MQKKNTNTTYTKVVKVSTEYLGPAAERFVDRQIINHLGKTPEQLTPKDIYALIDWMKVAMSVLSEDRELAEEYTMKLKEIANERQP